MDSGRTEQLEYILNTMSSGVAILDAATLQIQYVNSFLLSLLDEPWRSRDIVGFHLTRILPPELHEPITAHIREVVSTGKQARFDEIPYEGFLETRGRTYWRITIEQKGNTHLIITIEDVTETVRSRLHLHAIHSISSAIAGPTSLHLVLERIIQALYEMAGSKRCAIFLLDGPLSGSDQRLWGVEELSPSPPQDPERAIMAAQRGVHPCSQDWHPRISDHVLPGRVLRDKRTVIIADTQETPEIEYPALDYKGEPCQPGAALCVPIFEPHSSVSTSLAGSQQLDAVQTHQDVVLGTIEVYHRRARGFPAEEVELLERFAQQAGLAIQHARLFRSIDRWARTASRQARQKENIMQAIPDGVVIYDPRWRIADVNSAARTLFGWPDTIQGVFLLQAIATSQAHFAPDFLQMADPIMELERRALTGQIDEIKMLDATGVARMLQCTYTPIRDELGDIFAFITIYHDITREAAARKRIEAEVVARTAELKQRNEALQHAKATQELMHSRMALMLERLPSGVLLVDKYKGAITIINQQAVQILQSLGVPLEPDDNPVVACQRAIGLNCEPLLRALSIRTNTGVSLPYEEQPLYQALEYGRSKEAEIQIIRADGQPIFLLMNSAPLKNQAGQVTSAILVFQEISRIKLLERAREDFFTTMAHELKTPLANIRAHLSALLAHDLQWSNEEQYEFLETADEQVERIVGMINHFLDASRVEAGALRLECEPIFIPELFEDLQERLAALISTSQRSLRISLPSDLPAVFGDYELLINVLTNLLSNAFRYAPEGDFVLLSAIPVFDEQNRQSSPYAVRLSVTDHGIGISPEQQATLFTRFSTFAAMHRPSVDRPGQPEFERPRKISRWSPATGLGLYISRGIVEAHQSRLILSSIPGQETTFAFALAVYQQEHQNRFVAMVRDEHFLLEGRA